MRRALGLALACATATALAQVEVGEILGSRPAPEYPGLFAKFPTTITGPDTYIVLPDEATDVHFEGEMVVVIGKEAEILYRGAIDDRPTAKPGDVKGARNYVAEALDAVRAEVKALGGRAEVATPEQFTTKLMNAVNGVRKQAKLAPLALAARQSEIAARLAPRFFAAVMGKVDPLDADRIVLGIIAGWDIEGTVRQGGFSATMIGETRDVSRWLSTALEFPGGRQALLSPDTVLLAIGPLLVEQNQLLGAIVGSYSLFGDNHTADEATIFDLIARHRAGLGMSPPKRVDALDAHMLAAGRTIRSRAATPINTLNDLLQASARALQRSVNGFVLETSRLEDFRLPEELLRRRGLEVAIAVTHYQPPGEPWGRYVILVVVPAPLPSV